MQVVVCSLALFPLQIIKFLKSVFLTVYNSASFCELADITYSSSGKTLKVKRTSELIYHRSGVVRVSLMS